jgi:hypothetical protein
MTTIATLPDHIELRDGEEFDLRAVAKNGALVITRVMSAGRLSKAVKAPEKLTFTQKWGGTMSKIEDPDDFFLTHINEKHVK